jgi:Chaperone of endosialidase
MQNPLSLILSASARQRSLRISRSCGAFLSLVAMAYWGATPAAQADCREGCSGDNTFLGEDALLSNSGTLNTAVGYLALKENVFGTWSTAVGAYALINSTSSMQNTAVGAFAMQDNQSSQLNTAVGASAMQSNTTGDSNTALGWSALLSNQTGNANTVAGLQALMGNTTGSSNAAFGVNTLLFNQTGNDNTALGTNALLNNTGSSNIAIGESAGSALTTGKNNIDIGNAGTAGESAKIRIGNKAHKNIFVAGISGVTVAGGVGVIVDTSGHLGTVTSSKRYKEAVKPMNDASDELLSLKPVTFRYKKELDPHVIPQFGLVAEDVAKVDPDLVARDEEGKPYSVRYEAMNAMLLNEFLKEHREVEELQATVEEMKEKLQKVSARLKATNP